MGLIKMSDTSKLWIVVAAGGVIETSLLPYNLVHLRSCVDITVSTAISPAAEKFVTSTALQAITKNLVYQEQQLFDPLTNKPLHIAYSEADLLILYPATARIIAQCALGEVTCPVTRLFAFTPKERILIAPAIHSRMDKRIYYPHLNKLQELGCHVLNQHQEEDALYSLWSHIELKIAEMLEAEKLAPSTRSLELWPSTS
jgi:phosphopantothenoylcysteine decarboxylase / phosphopantothenate---cysteine ligase